MQRGIADTRLDQWRSVDWSRSLALLAAQMGCSISHAYVMARRLGLLPRRHGRPCCVTRPLFRNEPNPAA